MASFNSAVASLASSKVGAEPNTILGKDKSPSSAKSHSSHDAAVCTGTTSAVFAPFDDTPATNEGGDALPTDCSVGNATGKRRRPGLETPMPAIFAAVLITPPPPISAISKLRVAQKRNNIIQIRLGALLYILLPGGTHSQKITTFFLLSRYLILNR